MQQSARLALKKSKEQFLYSATVFIISKRKELSIKYKKLIEALEQEVCVISSLSEAVSQIQKKEPELLIVSDTIDEKLSDFCTKVRVLTFNTRPVIVAVSKSSELNDRLEILEAGADDFMSESISPKEFQARIKAHLRRFLENQYNPVTFFVQKSLTTRAVKKLIFGDKKNSVMLIRIANINFYREIYGEIAYQKVLQTLGAIVNSALNTEDFAGHFSDDEFIIITTPNKAEKVASFLTFAFDNVLNRFYSDLDYENKFTLLSSDIKEEEKESLMRLNICSIENEEGKFTNYGQIVNSLFELIKLCKGACKSTYVIDRPKLKGQVQSVKPKNKVMIMEEDEALSFLLETLCTMNLFEVKVCKNYEEFYEGYEEFRPDVLFIDWGNEYTKKGITLSRQIKALDNAPKIIFSSSVHNKKEILGAGADFYLPKPYEADVAIKWIKKFLN